MPRNGSGVYGPPAGTTAVPNTPIESAKYNAFVADASQAFTDSVNVQGTAPFQANQPMGGFKHTNLGAGSASTDSAQLGQAQSSIVAHAATVGGTARMPRRHPRSMSMVSAPRPSRSSTAPRSRSAISLALGTSANAFMTELTSSCLTRLSSLVIESRRSISRWTRASLSSPMRRQSRGISRQVPTSR
jgi:hypothetical protein